MLVTQNDFGTETMRIHFHLGSIFCGHILIETH